jgi:hypothetical protein
MSVTSNKRKLQRDARVARWSPDLKATAGITKATADDFKWLQKHVIGEVVLPGDPDYPAAAAQNPRYPEHPQAVVFCEAFEDVRACLAFAKKHDLWVAARSGRHSTAGFSTNDGLVIDTSRITYVTVDPERRTARVGAGTPFALLNAQLDLYGLHVPGGTCDDVCVAGFMQGGGYGLTSREFGVGCDSIVGALVMLANGKVVVASERKNHDLLWAIRGGTGGNFGVVLEFTFELQKVRELYGYAIQWPLADAPKVLMALQSKYMAGQTDPKVGYLAIVATLKGERVVAIIGTYDGSEADGKRALEPLMHIGTPKVLSSMRGTYAYLNDALFQVLPGPGDPTTLELKEAHYITKPVTEKDWAALCAVYEKTPNDFNLAVIEPYGGRINSRPKLWNAFVHREQSMDFFVDSFWDPSWPKCPDQKTAQAFLDATMDAMTGSFDGFVYQNYPRRDSPDYRWAYWGDGFPSLLFVKKKYDPQDVFHYAQSISPYPDDPKIHRSTAESIFRDPHIEYEPWS